MLNFKSGIASHIALTTTASGNVLFSTDTNELKFDLSNNERKSVKDTSAGHSLSFADDILSLKDANNNVLSSVDLELSMQPSLNMTDGHLYFDGEAGEAFNYLDGAVYEPVVPS